MTALRIGTHNVNGIRAAGRRGFGDFWRAAEADVVALQEVRCRIADLPEHAFGDHHVTYDPGTLAGRNGVAVLTGAPPARVRTLSGEAWRTSGGELVPITAETLTNRDLGPFRHEGRYLEVDLADAPVRVASLYLPKGAAWPHVPEGKDKYDRKMRFMRGLARQLTASRRDAAAEGREFLVMGDFNVAHTNLDLRNWRTNQRTEGFLPEERDWFGSLLGPRTLVDVVRRLHPETPGPYSWWSWRGQSFSNDVGWRIDYHLASPRLAASAVRGWSARESDYEARISDHCPVIVDYRV